MGEGHDKKFLGHGKARAGAPIRLPRRPTSGRMDAVTQSTPVSQSTPVTQSGVAVVGSINVDVIARVDRHPVPGETILGSDLVEHAGGKGLNQAVSAARRASTHLVGFVGDDASGSAALDYLAARGVDTGHVGRGALPTGRAFITVAADGENSIVVIPSANGEVTPAVVRAALDDIQPGVVVAQCEIPPASVEAAAGWARDHRARFVLNPSPITSIPGAVLGVCDPLVVNEGEAVAILQLVGSAPENTARDARPTVADLARALLPHVRSVVVTAGSAGAVAATLGEVTTLPAERVDVVDTTGAGDEFAGALAAALAMGSTLVDAVGVGQAAAALIVATPRDRR